MANEKKTKGESEQVRQKKEEKARASRRRNRQMIGFALTILIIVGAISIVSGGVNLVRNMLDTSEEAEYYQDLFEPLVWFDLLPFDSLAQVDENSLKQVCLWGAFTRLNNEGSVDRDDMGQPLIPQSEVDRYGIDLFGPNFRFTVHESFEDPLQGLVYYYSDETKMYTLQNTGLMPDYYASVVEVKRESGGVRRVVMGYISSRTSDDQVVPVLDYDHPTRYMDFMLRRDGNNYYLYALQNNTTHVPEVTGPASSQPAEADSLPEDLLPQSSGASSLPADEGAGSGAEDGSDGSGASTEADGGEDSSTEGTGEDSSGSSSTE